jgi:hypothetical protein
MIGRAVSSALAQALPGDEVIVVDDGSTDDTEQALDPYIDRIEFIKIPHGGAGVARNRGIEKARNDLIAFLDSDDEWLPGKQILQGNLMTNRPDILFCFSNLAGRTRDGETVHDFWSRWRGDKRGWNEILGPGEWYSSVASLPEGYSDFKFHAGHLYLAELATNFISTITLMVRRSLAGDALHFGEGLPTFEDWECFGHLTRRGPGAYLDCETACQISHTGPRLTGHSAAVSAEARMTIMKRVWGSDPEFMKEHEDLYRRTFNQQRLIKIRDLIAQGRAREARAELRLAESAPQHYKVLSRIPGALLRGLAGLRRRILGLF